jgi:hypothetical protein
MITRPWTICVPVISTVHCPDNGSLQALAFGDRPVAIYEDGAFIYLSHPAEATYTPGEQWLVPIASWLHALLGANCSGWIRLDSCGDVIPDLPTFYWE